ncbi:DUF309 domain-containing protein [Calidifontibacillus oryziterrae]|uniref:DUF309 domain-containing protein n=1 Tax=Calidifontibacillus oryziterrae TaxID=1191699 RepID=UPI0002ED9A4F|nr:DUF309 domain-containing protein [Calidifontibacillus oryziterrae]
MFPNAYINYLVFFHGPRDYFECHEVLEEYWKQNKDEGRDSIWVGLIQVAVAFYHHRNNNFNGSARLLKKALSNLKNKKEALSHLGIEYENLIMILNRRLCEIEKKQTYYSLNIPIADKNLLQTCMKCCEQMGFKWDEPSDILNLNLIQKHKLRDRTMIIEERKKQIQKKQNEKINRPHS